MRFSVRAKLEPVRRLAAAAIAGASPAYIAIQTPLTNQSKMLFVQNLTDVQLMFSHDGINDHYPLPTAGYAFFDTTSNKTSLEGFYIPAGTTVYVRQEAGGAAPTTGEVFVTTFYGEENV